MRHKAITILESMLEGIPVEIGGSKFALSEEGDILSDAQRLDLKTGKTQECWMNTFRSVSFLLKLAKKMTDEEQMLVGANVVLNQKIRGK